MLVVAIVVLALTAPVAIVVVAVALVCLASFSVTYLVRAWPAAIAVDADGIHFGRLTGHARRRVAPSMQPWGRFDVPWSAVRSAHVVDDVRTLRADTRALARSAPQRPAGAWNPVAPTSSTGFAVGRIVPHGARAALVVELYAGATVDAPTFKSRHGQGVAPSSTWTIATRRPEQLRAALATHTPTGVR